MSDSSKYLKRGVSATKDEVHNAIRHLDKGLYKNAFCKILPDLVGGDDKYCNIMHADTAGTKTSLAYLYWRETGDLSVWKGIAQDAIVMNLDDMACVGCCDDIVISSTIGRNKHLIPGEVIAALINGANDFFDMLLDHGVHVKLAGGETADVGDIVRTIDVGYTTFARMRRSDLVVNNIQPGQVIIGLASFGQATYEDSYNGGMGSNGLTGARHDVLYHDYASKYPDSYDSNTDESYVYTGRYGLLDTVDLGELGISNIGRLLLSPTRTYLPVLKPLLDKYREGIHGIIHNTGGGLTKVSKFASDVRIVKDNLFENVPLFDLIHDASGTPWKEMYQVFNMGHRLELYVDESAAEDIMGHIRNFNIDTRIVGRVEPGSGTSVVVKTNRGEFTYE